MRSPRAPPLCALLPKPCHQCHSTYCCGHTPVGPAVKRLDQRACWGSRPDFIRARSTPIVLCCSDAGTVHREKVWKFDTTQRQMRWTVHLVWVLVLAAVVSHASGSGLATNSEVQQLDQDDTASAALRVEGDAPAQPGAATGTGPPRRLHTDGTKTGGLDAVLPAQDPLTLRRRRLEGAGIRVMDGPVVIKHLHGSLVTAVPGWSQEENEVAIERGWARAMPWEPVPGRQYHYDWVGVCTDRGDLQPVGVIGAVAKYPMPFAKYVCWHCLPEPCIGLDWRYEDRSDRTLWTLREVELPIGLLPVHADGFPDDTDRVRYHILASDGRRLFAEPELEGHYSSQGEFKTSTNQTYKGSLMLSAADSTVEAGHYWKLVNSELVDGGSSRPEGGR